MLVPTTTSESLTTVLLGYTKFELTCGGHLMVALHYSGVWAQVGAGAPRRTTSSIMSLSGVGDL